MGEEMRVLMMLARGRYTQLSIRNPLVSQQLLHVQCGPVYRMRRCLIVLGSHHSFSGGLRNQGPKNMQATSLLGSCRQHLHHVYLHGLPKHLLGGHRKQADDAFPQSVESLFQPCYRVYPTII